MRFLILATLATTLVGCADLRLGPPADAVHPFAATKSIEEFLGRSASASEAADVKLADLATKVARTNDLLAELVDNAKLSNGQQCDLLDQIKAVKASPPVPPEPPKASSQRSAVETPEVTVIPQNEAIHSSRDLIRTKDGRQWALADFIRSYYRYPVEVRGMTVDTHLRRDHGVSYAAGLSQAEKEQLHAASHEYERANNIQREAPQAATLVSSDCPDGKCPLRSRTVTVTTPDSTRSRSVSTYSSPPPESSPVVYSSAPVYRYSWTHSPTRCSGRKCRR